jgi:hypothetical protein
LGGVVGGYVARWLEYLRESPVGIFAWNNWHATMVLSMLTRAGAVCFLINMPDPGAATVRDLMRHMGLNVYNAVAGRLLFALRIVGWRRSNNGSDDAA